MIKTSTNTTKRMARKNATQNSQILQKITGSSIMHKLCIYQSDINVQCMYSKTISRVDDIFLTCDYDLAVQCYERSSRRLWCGVHSIYNMKGLLLQHKIWYKIGVTNIFLTIIL